MVGYFLRCVLCDAKFPSFGAYEKHVVTAHTERLDLRMKPEIVKEG